MGKLNRVNLLYVILVLSTLFGCREITVPKPKGHFRIDLPEKAYTLFSGSPGKNSNIPFSFEYPVYGKLIIQPAESQEPGWFNIEFPAYHAKIYLTYKAIKNDFAALMEQSYKMNVKNHITKADAINEQQFNNEGNRVFGILYDLRGNTASAVQFYVTDSVNHYLRGSLYFAAEPNADSLAPVIEYFREDVIHLIESLKWNN